MAEVEISDRGVTTVRWVELARVKVEWGEWEGEEEEGEGEVVMRDRRVKVVREAYEEVMGQWLLEPQQLTRTVLRGDLLVDYPLDPSDPPKELEGHPSLTGGQEVTSLRRLSLRRLLPRRRRDTSIVQLVYSYTEEGEETGFHTCHAPVIPPTTDSVPSYYSLYSAPSQFPSFHPEVRRYRLSLYSHSEELAVAVEFFSGDRTDDGSASPGEGTEIFQKTQFLLTKVLTTLRKFIKNHINGYQKRVHHDLLVPKVKYQDTYQVVKESFQGWVERWPEATDPAKFVFEELGIATFLTLLWEKPTTFIDLGCGNGFLTHLLTELGHRGYGIDQVPRKIWSQYPTTTRLQATTLLPPTFRSDGEEWLVGNHSDELTPWIPIMAALSGYHTKFMILPCCYYDLTGAKYTGTQPHHTSRYDNYLRYLHTLIATCGYVVETEFLRIPSTKNLALVGRRRTFPPDDQATASQIQSHLLHLISDLTFTPRTPDYLKAQSHRHTH